MITIEQPGIWIADLAEGTVRRVADAGTFDVAGNTLLTARGRDVYSSPVAGGTPAKLYTAPTQGPGQLSSGYTVDLSRESVVGIEATPDGSAVVAVFAPVVAPNGQDSGRNGDFFLVGSNGQKINPEYPLTDCVRWSRDGTRLAAITFARTTGSEPSTTPTSYTWSKALAVLGRDGTAVGGPFIDSRYSTCTGLRWTPGGGLLGRFTDTWTIVDTTNGSAVPVPYFNAGADMGPDLRLVGVKSSDREGSVEIFDPATGTATPIAHPAYDPVWAPDGRAVLYLDTSIGEAWTPQRYVVADHSGSPRMTLNAAVGLQFGRDGLGLSQRSFPSPEFSASSRYLVLVARPR